MYSFSPLFLLPAHAWAHPQRRNVEKYKKEYKEIPSREYQSKYENKIKYRSRKLRRSGRRGQRTGSFFLKIVNVQCIGTLNNRLYKFGRWFLSRVHPAIYHEKTNHDLHKAAVMLRTWQGLERRKIKYNGAHSERVSARNQKWNGWLMGWNQHSRSTEYSRPRGSQI